MKMSKHGSSGSAVLKLAMIGSLGLVPLAMGVMGAGCSTQADESETNAEAKAAAAAAAKKGDSFTCRAGILPGDSKKVISVVQLSTNLSVSKVLNYEQRGDKECWDKTTLAFTGKAADGCFQTNDNNSGITALFHGFTTDPKNPDKDGSFRILTAKKSSDGSAVQVLSVPARIDGRNPKDDPSLSAAEKKILLADSYLVGQANLPKDWKADQLVELKFNKNWSAASKFCLDANVARPKDIGDKAYKHIPPSSYLVYNVAEHLKSLQTPEKLGVGGSGGSNAINGAIVTPTTAFNTDTANNTYYVYGTQTPTTAVATNPTTANTPDYDPTSFQPAPTTPSPVDVTGTISIGKPSTPGLFDPAKPTLVGTPVNATVTPTVTTPTSVTTTTPVTTPVSATACYTAKETTKCTGAGREMYVVCPQVSGNAPDVVKAFSYCSKLPSTTFAPNGTTAATGYCCSEYSINNEASPKLPAYSML